MLEVLVQMAGLILCGVGWRWLKPAGLEPVQTRKVLTSLVYYLLLPALVLSVLWEVELGNTSFLIALSAAFAVFTGFLLSSLVCRVCKARPAVRGAVILAAAFPNATYLGLPVLEATFGPWARSVAIQFDLFACTPLLFTLGVLIAARNGTAAAGVHNMTRELLRIPALWAALLAVSLNLLDVEMHTVLDGLLGMLERGVVPLMLFSLGLSLEWNRTQWRNLPTIAPVLLLRLLLVPALVALFASVTGLSGELRAAVVMEAAMPSMVLGIVFCDRYKLDVGLYATTVTMTTVLSLVTLPLWYRWLLG
ncbi:MAG: AEC family transporter [Pseudomonadota bacterium]|nr:AEC family transporter [Pseudomonadota bacterium]